MGCHQTQSIFTSKIKNVSAHEINEDKQSILYQVVIKNDCIPISGLGQVWAGSLYSMTGLKQYSCYIFQTIAAYQLEQNPLNVN